MAVMVAVVAAAVAVAVAVASVTVAAVSEAAAAGALRPRHVPPPLVTRHCDPGLFPPPRQFREAPSRGNGSTSSGGFVLFPAGGEDGEECLEGGSDANGGGRERDEWGDLPGLMNGWNREWFLSGIVVIILGCSYEWL